jgi:hypothetical protein
MTGSQKELEFHAAALRLVKQGSCRLYTSVE